MYWRTANTTRTRTDTTVDLADALAIVRHMVDYGRPPPGAAWHVDG
jgi:hypothetical protein